MYLFFGKEYLECLFYEKFKMIYIKDSLFDYINDIKIFEDKFVKNNKDKCLIIYKNKVFPLISFFPFDKIEKKDKKLEITLIGLGEIFNKSTVFH